MKVQVCIFQMGDDQVKLSVKGHRIIETGPSYTVFYWSTHLVDPVQRTTKKSIDEPLVCPLRSNNSAFECKSDPFKPTKAGMNAGSIAVAPETYELPPKWKPGLSGPTTKFISVK